MLGKASPLRSISKLQIMHFDTPVKRTTVTINIDDPHVYILTHTHEFKHEQTDTVTNIQTYTNRPPQPHLNPIPCLTGLNVDKVLDT